MPKKVQGTLYEVILIQMGRNQGGWKNNLPLDNVYYAPPSGYTVLPGLAIAKWGYRTKLFRILLDELAMWLYSGVWKLDTLLFWAS